jgi:hypothetical protein
MNKYFFHHVQIPTQNIDLHIGAFDDVLKAVESLGKQYPEERIWISTEEVDKIGTAEQLLNYYENPLNNRP